MSGQAYDIFILGGGPAGLSAALTARARGRRVMVLTNDPAASPLAKAGRIDNYPGLTGVSGLALLEAMVRGVKEQGIELVLGRATGVMTSGGRFYITAEQDFYEAKSLILATGAQQGTKPVPGEAELLGKGASYCATCDGMLYRGRDVAVLDMGGPGREAADFLQSLGCRVEYFDKKRAKSYAISGDDKVEAVVADGVSYPVAGVFVMRATMAAETLLPGLALEEGHIRVDKTMAASVTGVFAAGDCAGRPYQVARAVGQGNMAALSADKYLQSQENQ
ncbi:MAG: NAD(P)/FAD-dependent oxidoreductase [Oscillospiraceae bacterium]|nr:NAD(P)/FAD-dependent oxidoreductase [Oscillospiraceae bacterium]